MRAIDQAFEAWAARVEQLVGRPIDRKEARAAFEIHDRPIKPITPDEYAWELWGDLNGYPPHWPAPSTPRLLVPFVALALTIAIIAVITVLFVTRYY